MKASGPALTSVTTRDLKKMLRGLYRNDLTVPLTIEGLTCVGLQHTSEPLLGHMRTLPRESMMAVLTAVVAERIAEEKKRAEEALAVSLGRGPTPPG